MSSVSISMGVVDRINNRLERKTIPCTFKTKVAPQGVHTNAPKTSAYMSQTSLRHRRVQGQCMKRGKVEPTWCWELWEPDGYRGVLVP